MALVIAIDGPAAAGKGPNDDDRDKAPSTIASVKEEVSNSLALTPSRGTKRATGPTDPRAMKGEVLGGRFRLERIIGEGAMGVVWFAKDLDGGGFAAVKLILDPIRSAANLARFEREILASQSVEHELVIQNLASGQAGEGLCYLAMEFVQGEELADVLLREQALPRGRALGLFDQLCLAVQACHDAGIVHRDIKPENVLVTRRDGRETIKLMDFGIARFLNRAEAEQATGSEIYSTIAGKVSGTPAYLSPEALKGDKVTPAADIYSLGVTLFELLTGKLPFDETTESALISAHLFSEPLQLTDQKPDLEVPMELQDLLDMMLEKIPEDRPESCDAILERLRGPVRAALSKR